jgi:hypothetical protein
VRLQKYPLQKSAPEGAYLIFHIPYPESRINAIESSSLHHAIRQSDLRALDVSLHFIIKILFLNGTH